MHRELGGAGRIASPRATIIHHMPWLTFAQHLPNRVLLLADGMGWSDPSCFGGDCGVELMVIMSTNSGGSMMSMRFCATNSFQPVPGDCAIEVR